MFFSNKKDRYISLFLSENNLIVSYIDPKAEQKIIKEFKSNIEDTTELMSFLESVLDDIKEEFKDKPNKIIFFLSSFYIDKDSGKIKKVYLKEFSDICKKLSLKILGYIETLEAVIKKHISESDTAVFAEIDSSRVFANFIEKGAVSAAIFNLFVEDKLENIKEGVVNVLPDGNRSVAKLIFANYLNLPKLDQDLKELDWLNILGLNQQPEVILTNLTQLNQVLVELFCSEIAGGSAETRTEGVDDHLSANLNEPVSAETAVGRSTLPFGFSEVDNTNQDNTEQLRSDQPILTSYQTATVNSSFSVRFLSGFSSFREFFSVSGLRSKLWLLPFILLVLGLVGLVLANEFYVHQLVLEVKPQTTEIKYEHLLSGSELGDLITYETQSVSAAEKTATSGTQQVGEKAKGEITVYNFSTQSFSLEKGSKININGKTFLTDLDLNLDPAQEATVEGSIVKKPTTGSVGITAENIGSDYNLSYSDKIKIGDLNTDLYYAKLTKPTTGGSQEELNTVAKSDLEKLREEVLQKAKDQFTSAEFKFDESNYFYIPELNEYRINKEEFDKEVNEVADSIAISAEVEARLALLDKAKLLRLIEPELQKELKPNYSYASEDLQIEYTKTNDEEPSYNFSITAIAKYNLDKTNLRSLLVFKQKPKALELVKNQQGVQDAVILEEKSLIPFSPFTPVFADRIIIE
ncbi:MAG: hypothetical protein KatS3mg091_516 [Patescibacteria group bacterium]|nr:MAG: hypothetical protein KatS3mg091_516 [Patescibacteria group bacterium]